MKHDGRPEPEGFLDPSIMERRGWLKIYIGAAAGVGKTWRMLEEAHQLRARGTDVVIGFVETHGRAETAEKVGQLELIPRRRLEYRGVILEEPDLEAIIARAPEVALLDELAHTNAPGSSHEKRHQDVGELVSHGISVITAMNIQHVASVAPVVERTTGVAVRETVPDSFLAGADQIVNVDLTVEALRERLREGKIYPQPQVDAALRNFFKPTSLTALRELSLREVAHGLNRQRERRTARTNFRPDVTERVMAGLSSNPAEAGTLLQRAARIAAQLDAAWFAVHVETPAESIRKISTRDFRRLLDNINLAAELGAETMWLKGDDVARAMLEFAREQGITRIIVGRTHQPFWRRWFGRDIPLRLIKGASDLDVQIVGDETGAR